MATALLNAFQKIQSVSEKIEKVQKNIFVKATQSFFSGAVEAANQRINAEQRLVSVMSRNSGVTQEGIQLVRNYAQELGKTTAIASNVGLSGFSQLATHVKNPENLKDLGDSLYNLATKMHGTKVSAENMTKVADIMGEALNGKTDALTKNGFVLTEQQQNIFKYGTELEKTTALIDLIEGEFGGLAEAMASTPEGQIQQMKNSWNDVMEVIGFGLIPVILDFVNLINENMPTIEMLLVGAINIISFAVSGLIPIISWLFEAIQRGVEIAIATLLNLGAIFLNLAPFILTAASAWLIYNLIINFSTIKTSIFNTVQKAFYATMAAGKAIITAVAAAFRLFNIVVSMNPLGILITVVIVIISAILSFIGVLKNLRQIFSSVFGFIVDVAESSLNFVVFLINSVIKGINSVSGLLNKILKIDVGQIPEIEFRADFSGVKEAGQDFIENFSLEDVKNKIFQKPEMPDLFDPGAESDLFSHPTVDLPGDDLGGFGSNGFSAPPTDGNVGDIGKVGEVGKIRDSVDVSSEDIKIMRELAEMKNIQNFVSLTPSVSVQTGDITSGHDIDTIINRITNTLETQIASGAKGVWKV